MVSIANLRESVRAAYSAVAEHPGARHPFPSGRVFAENLGYPAELLDRIPAASVEAFTGVTNLAASADIPPSSRVIDLGCGAGLDSLLLAQRLNHSGMVLGVDFSFPMLDRARRSAAELSLNNAIYSQADAERLPIPTASFDTAIVNGIFNLNPARQAIFRELARAIRPGGRLYASELILLEPRPAASNPLDWFA
jgi:arsenite methyltransferase